MNISGLTISLLSLWGSFEVAWFLSYYLNEWYYNIQIPLDKWTDEEKELAFKWLPFDRARIEEKGTMSKNEFIELQDKSLKAIHDEMNRRGIKKQS